MRDVNIHYELLKIDGADINNTALTSGTQYWTDPVRVRSSRGYTALLVILTGGSDDVDISFQVSLNGDAFYTPVNTSGVSLGVIYTTLTASAWIVFAPQIAMYLRFLFDPDADSTVTAYYLHQE